MSGNSRIYGDRRVRYNSERVRRRSRSRQRSRRSLRNRRRSRERGHREVVRSNSRRQDRRIRRRRRSRSRGTSIYRQRDSRRRSSSRRRSRPRQGERNRRSRVSLRNQEGGDRKSQQEPVRAARGDGDDAGVNPFMQGRDVAPVAPRSQVEEEEQKSSRPATSKSFPFPSDPGGEFVQAMSTIACNAGAEAKGIFSNLSGGWGIRIIEINWHKC